MKTTVVPLLVLLSAHLGSTQQYHTWRTSWSTGSQADPNFASMWRKVMQNIGGQQNLELIFGGKSTSRRPTAALPNQTPGVPPKRSSPPPPPPPPATKVQYNPEQNQPQEPPADIKPMSLGCTKEYKAIARHTLCMTDKPNVSKQGVTEAQKKAILDQHNRLRAGVQPPATDLVELQWDERLAAVAQKWANQCEAGHDKHRNILSIGMSIGQNVAGGYRTWEQAVQMWWDEIDMWTYGVDPDSYLGPGGWRKIGHFTQMAQNGTYMVGCGFAVCDRSTFTRYYVCDYAAGQSNLAAPYTSGKRCSRCPKFCRNGQCDCGGKVCYNGGTLNIETCQCECQKVYKGPTCEELDCPAKDKWVCGRDWTPAYCEKFVNVPFDCPYMCGKCKSPTGESTSVIEKQTSFTSKYGCTYSGKRSSPAECRSYGSKGMDIDQCSSNGGSISCADCKRFFNVKKDMCPVMCGLCDPPCNGKKCANGGKLDIDKCTCTCKRPYVGDRCERADCSKPDKDHCANWPGNYCSEYGNVPEDCPKKCGLC
ncbi:uncharacterized protein LOC125663866 [Ostrea edulis]|uniref:uncharacterized protein LOC125663866 n=1 Tax=Ostrea edulis TaxID=37623 RepID=UPI0024AFC0CB|nr:uncharacterized protein LOC125663866 [Ostrea edulis]XP_056014368.1 uncharacterized protein LOC125663866 [Ostrea edulis]